ncbi:VIT1/CCC1 transporter family protein [Mesorhizobium sp. LHD-90]|uniref:VIT1/CCC1 transporter family protein n=1 Tax=Mesorhizobium sp. LHD-90 TaxID=3071414 RepID=UPI0027E0937B|nr:VIT1/CCC1 transporter family protein [Mesorhizobium sp. LHD-90]MDQ6436371.1 VIT1/CCC1 transporter family protein [Mesorhizobium sp. LHD-90]
MLDPIDRLSEVIFGLLMALSFTGTMSVAVGEGDKVGTVLWAALGCNLAWGIVDGVMFALTTAVERAKRLNFIEDIRILPSAEARLIFLAEMPEDIRLATSEADAENVVTRIKSLPASDHRRIMGIRDVGAAVSICLLVIASTLPPSMPFLFVDDLPTAMRVSNVVSVAMLFLIGARLGNYMGRSPWPMALAMSAIGSFLVVITIALGG